MRPILKMRRGGRRFQLAAALAAALLMLSACGGDDDDNDNAAAETTATTAAPVGSGGTEAAPLSEVTVAMTDALKFDPPEIVLKVGGKVTWRNPSTVVHPATDDPAKVADATHVELPSGAVPWNSDFISNGQSFTQEFTVPGTYRYACIPHEGVGMLGTITVVP